MTAVYYAAAQDQVQILEILLKFGGNPGQTDSEGRTALHHACSRRGEVLCLSVLLRPRSKPLQSKEDTSQLLASAQHGSHATSILSSQGRNRLDPDGQNHAGQTALMLAVDNENTDVIRSLLLHGCNPNITDQKGFTVIHYAWNRGLESVRPILKDTTIDWNRRVSALINKVKCYNVTVLHIAAARLDNWLECLLHENVVSDINSVTECGVTALFVAVWSGFPQNVSLLLSKGADATIIAQSGECPLHMAARFGDHQIVRRFLDHGCDARIKNEDGLDAELIALKHSHHELAEFFGQFARERGK